MNFELLNTFRSCALRNIVLVGVPEKKPLSYKKLAWLFLLWLAQLAPFLWDKGMPFWDT